MGLNEKEKQRIEEEEKYRAKMVSKYHSPIHRLEKKHNRSKVVAGLLAILLGGIGVHKFYLGKPGWGLLYFIFSWTFIPAILGFIEGIIYLTMSDKAFEAKYS